MDRLTPLEKALLLEFETHMNDLKDFGASERQLLSALANTLKTLSNEFERISKRQNDIESKLERLTQSLQNETHLLNSLNDALATQSSATQSLITQVNRLMSAQDD